MPSQGWHCAVVEERLRKQEQLLGEKEKLFDVKISKEESLRKELERKLDGMISEKMLIYGFTPISKNCKVKEFVISSGCTAGYIARLTRFLSNWKNNSSPTPVTPNPHHHQTLPKPLRPLRRRNSPPRFSVYIQFHPAK